MLLAYLSEICKSSAKKALTAFERRYRSGRCMTRSASLLRLEFHEFVPMNPQTHEHGHEATNGPVRYLVVEIRKPKFDEFVESRDSPPLAGGD